MTNVIPFPMKGGEIVRRARKLRGYTQAELAHLYGISEKTLRDYEKQKYPISYDDVQGILQMLNIASTEELKDVA